MVCVAGLLGSGCALLNPPDGAAALPEPERWGNAQSRADRRPRSAGKSKAQHDGPWKLKECIRTAVENNPGLASARWNVRSAEESRSIARAAALPDLSLTGSYRDYLNDQPLTPVAGNPRGIIATDDIVEGHLQLEMPLYTGGRIRHSIAAADLQKQASRSTLARNRNEVVFEVSRTFYDILARRHVIESLKANRKALTEHLEQVKALIENAKATKVDRLRTEVRLADMRQELAKARNGLQTRRQSLATLMGIRGGGEPPRVEGTLTFEARSLPDRKNALQTARKQRDDYRSLRAKVEAQKRRVTAARAELWPTVSLQASYGDRWDASDMRSPEDVGNAGVGVSLPLFEGGRIRAEVRRQKAELESARQRLRKLELQIRLEVETALNNLSSARERVDATKKSIEQAEESLRTQRLRYRNGKASITDVLDAQAGLLESQKNYYRALAAWNTSLSEFRLATGKDMQGEAQ
ncbi:MAG: TolC family protein [Planctomycetota bacterium]